MLEMQHFLAWWESCCPHLKWFNGAVADLSWCSVFVWCLCRAVLVPSHHLSMLCTIYGHMESWARLSSTPMLRAGDLVVGYRVVVCRTFHHTKLE